MDSQTFSVCGVMDKKIIADNLGRMGRYNKRTVPVSSQQMREYSAVIKQLAAVHDCLAALIADNRLDAVEMRNFQSASDALENFARYMGAATECISDAIIARGNEHLEAGRDASTADYAARQTVKQLLALRNEYMEKHSKAWDAAERSAEARGIIAEQIQEQEKGPKRRKPARNNG